MCVLQYRRKRSFIQVASRQPNALQEDSLTHKNNVNPNVFWKAFLFDKRGVVLTTYLNDTGGCFPFDRQKNKRKEIIARQTYPQLYYCSYARNTITLYKFAYQD
jgi:hypothetical protein